MNVKVITDSTSYIPRELQEELDINVIPLSVNFPDESFLETEVDYDYFYNKIETTGIIPTSSQPSGGEIYQQFKEFLEKGQDILAIFLSSLQSGTYQTALSIREQLLNEFPNAKIDILDSRFNSMALGYPVLEAARAAAQGFPLNQITALATDVIKRMNFYFTPSTLEYLKKGGRIGGAAALLGQIIKVRPILFVDNGDVGVNRISRSFNGAINEMLSILDRDFKQKGLQHVIVHHITFLEKAQELKQLIMDRYNISAPIMSIGPTIGLHVGPGSIGLVYCTEQ